MEHLGNDPKKTLDEAFELLKEAKDTFQHMSQLEDNDVYYDQKRDADELVTLCVQASLVVMSLRMNQTKKYIVTSSPGKMYPYLQMS